MATAEQVVVNPDHLLGGDGTIETAMRLWSARNSPVTYNKWQSLYFYLRKNDYSDDAKVVGETQKQLQVRLLESYQKIQEEIHGPDYSAQAQLVPKAKAKARQETASAAARTTQEAITTELANTGDESAAAAVPSNDRGTTAVDLRTAQPRGSQCLLPRVGGEATKTKTA